MAEGKRPKDAVIKFIIKEVLKEKKAKTQAELRERVSSKLKSNDKGYSLSGRRTRVLAAELPDVDVHIQTRQGNLPAKCPCCSHALRKMYNKNLSGRKLLVSLSCRRCGYTGSGNKWMPRRYEFELKK